ncbi:MAG: hypothetical protein D6675_08200, partial [Gemmatimonadetes bacterium]
CYSNIGIVYKNLSDYDQALEYYMKAIKIYDEVGDKVRIARTYHNIGVVYQDQQYFEQALEYYNRSRETFEAIGDRYGAAGSYNNIGIVYWLQEEYDQALTYYQKSLAIREAIGDQNGIAHCYSNIADYYHKKGESEKSLEFHRNALNIYEKLKDKYGIARSKLSMGDAEIVLGNLKAARLWLQQGLSIALEIGVKDLEFNFYKTMSELAEIEGDYQSALDYYRRYAELKESIFNEEKSRQIAEMQTRYESEKNKREAEIYRLRNVELAREREKSERLLLNILPQSIVNDLKETGKTEPELFHDVSVFFSDFAGFTKISSGLPAGVIINELSDLFTRFDEIMEKNRCERIKTIGDAYLAVCGMPQPNEHHAHNLVNAALEILEYLKNRNRTHDLTWYIRIGIHSGEVVGGVVGTKKYLYDIFGDTVNTASRMESNSEPMRINISEMTYSILQENVEAFNIPVKFIPRQPQEVKGKGNMRMYFVEAIE